MKKTEIDIAIVNNVESRMKDAIYHFKSFKIQRDDIKIYMPDCFNRMFSYHKVMPPNYEKITSYNGVDVVEGYENKVIISVKNNVLYKIKPIEIEL